MVSRTRSAHLLDPLADLALLQIERAVDLEDSSNWVGDWSALGLGCLEYRIRRNRLKSAELSLDGHDATQRGQLPQTPRDAAPRRTDLFIGGVGRALLK